MPGPRRHRDRRPARRAPFLQPKRRFLVLCEGKVTEPGYLRGFRRAHRDALVELEIPKEHGVPLTLVKAAKARKSDAAEAAAREKDENLAFDEVWCVFDVDEHPNTGDARTMARDNGIELAVSNPCFELWLLVHFEDPGGLRDRQRVRADLLKHLPSYQKSVAYEQVEAGYSDAVRRAAKLDTNAASVDEAGRNPTTGVYRLTEAIRQAGV